MTRVHIRPVIPKRPMAPDAETAQIIIENALDEMALQAKELYEKTTATWKHQVKFSIVRVKDGRVVGTDDAIYGYVDHGTKPHIIRARRAPLLRFKVRGFKAKTKVGVLSSYRGAPGQDWRSAVSVKHPGTKARKFSAIINTKMTQQIGRDIGNRFKKVVGK